MKRSRSAALQLARHLTLLLACQLTLVLAAGSAGAQSGGGARITGKITDKELDEEVSFIHVVLAKDGAVVMNTQTKLDGSYVFDAVPPGTYQIRVTSMGYHPYEKPVTVAAGQTVTHNIVMTSDAIKIKEIEVVGEKPVVDVESSASERSFATEEAKVRVVNTVEDALSTQAGVVSVGGQIFVRGGRSNEVKYYVDGLPVTDPLSGGNSMNVSLASLEDVSLLSGGFDAEFGNAQSGVVQLTTKEGSPKITGLAKFMTDDFGAPDKTYFNFDNLQFGMGGPTPISGLAFYGSGEGVFEDTYLRTQEKRPKHRFLGLEFRERQRAQFSGQGKLSYKFLGKMKLVGELLYSQESFDGYSHPYSRVGYWSPTAGPQNQGLWFFDPIDSTFTYYNAPEHTPNVDNRHTQGHLRLTHTLSDATFYSATLGVHRFRQKVDVKGKASWDYDVTTGNQNDLDPLNLFYIIRGDAATWRRQGSTTYTLRADVTNERGQKKDRGHRFKAGMQGDWFDLEMDDRNFPSEDAPYGLFPDRYEVSAWQMSAFVQDRMKYDGMVVNAGLRLDMFDPSRLAFRTANERRVLLGLQPYPEDVLDRLIYQFSPRLGMAYPITDRDVLHFHYGRFQEVPRFENLYEKIGGDSEIDPNTIVGNPFLDATTSISYEVGIEHQFWGRSSINLTFFYRDIFGLIDTDREQAASFDPRNPPGITYVNAAYGTAQGVEFGLKRHLTPTSRWSGGVTYTYSQARGSSSSETQGFNVLTGGQDRRPITELALDWDRPHVVQGHFYVTSLGVWGVNMEMAYSSGSPYTPLGLYDKEIPVDRINTGRLPEVFEVSLKADKRYKIYGQEFSFFLEGRNLSNRKNVFNLTPGGANSYYNIYFTDQGQLGGAYNLRDVRQDLEDDVLIPLHDPRVYDEPRSFRIGLQFDW